MDQVASYQALAGALMAVCPAGFSQAKIVASLDSDWSEIRYDCDTPSGPKNGLSAPMEIDVKVDDALHTLRDGMTQEQTEPWKSCIFTLFPDGQFKFDVQYED